MKFSYNPAQLQACADLVAMLNHTVFKDAADAADSIRGVLFSAKNNEYVVRSPNTACTIATGGYMLVIDPVRDDCREVHFVVDPFIADLSNYMRRPDNCKVEF